MDDCIQKARDFRADGAKYNSSGVLVHGLGTTADSLAVIKKMVFEEGKISLNELVNILKQNFNGNEALRLMLVNKYPKLGNSDEYVDDIAARLVADFTDILSNYRNHFGGRFRAGFNTPSTHVHYGANTSATPDGRSACEPFSYGTGPSQGRSLKGPTSILCSMISLPQTKATLGTDLSISFNPSNLNSKEKLEKLGALIKAYFSGGGHHIMFNIIKPETLRDAQRNPEKYSDLVVRIHGYSAYFNSLTKEIQDDLIERIECNL
jgi:formate C-acetyltransferase